MCLLLNQKKAFKRNKNTQELKGGYLINDGKFAKKKLEMETAR